MVPPIRGTGSRMPSRTLSNIVEVRLVALPDSGVREPFHGPCQPFGPGHVRGPTGRSCSLAALPSSRSTSLFSGLICSSLNDAGLDPGQVHELRGQVPMAISCWVATFTSSPMVAGDPSMAGTLGRIVHEDQVPRRMQGPQPDLGSSSQQLGDDGWGSPPERLPGSIGVERTNHGDRQTEAEMKGQGDGPSDLAGGVRRLSFVADGPPHHCAPCHTITSLVEVTRTRSTSASRAAWSTFRVPHVGIHIAVRGQVAVGYADQRGQMVHRGPRRMASRIKWGSRNIAGKHFHGLGHLPGIPSNHPSRSVSCSGPMHVPPVLPVRAPPPRGCHEAPAPVTSVPGR